MYATEWTSSAISIWFFPRSAIPGDIASGKPNPASWGTPLAKFAGNCNIDQHFGNQQIVFFPFSSVPAIHKAIIAHMLIKNKIKQVFDTTFCGDWAGNVWGSSSCASKGSCTDFVANNPAAFKEAYWKVNSLKVYQGSSNAATNATFAQVDGKRPPMDLRWSKRMGGYE